MMKLVADRKTRSYELTYLLPADLAEADLTAAREAVLALVKKYKGKVLTTEDWGKKPLAYVIKKAGKKHQEAIYTHSVIEFFADQVQKFEKELYLNEQLMRHLLVVGEEGQAAEEEKSSDKKEEKN